MGTRHKPLRTLKTPVGAPDHFTIEQVRAAVLAVMASRGETPVPDVMEPSPSPRQSCAPQRHAPE
jgi:hypothetical protein